jgi:hypothetical protein
MSNLTKKLIIALGITIVLGGGYMVSVNLKSSDIDTNLATPQGALTSDAAQQTAKFLADIQKLQTYKLDTSFFNDSRFRALIDFRQEITDVNTGRQNPFDKP